MHLNRTFYYAMTVLSFYKPMRQIHVVQKKYKYMHMLKVNAQRKKVSIGAHRTTLMTHSLPIHLKWQLQQRSSTLSTWH